MALKHCEPGARGPLEGVRILDLSRLVVENTLTPLLGAPGMPRTDIGARISRGIVCDDADRSGAQGEGE